MPLNHGSFGDLAIMRERVGSRAGDAAPASDVFLIGGGRCEEQARHLPHRLLDGVFRRRIPWPVVFPCPSCFDMNVEQLLRNFSHTGWPCLVPGWRCPHAFAERRQVERHDVQPIVKIWRNLLRSTASIKFQLLARRSVHSCFVAAHRLNSPVRSRAQVGLLLQRQCVDFVEKNRAISRAANLPTFGPSAVKRADGPKNSISTRLAAKAHKERPESFGFRG